MTAPSSASAQNQFRRVIANCEGHEGGNACSGFSNNYPRIALEQILDPKALAPVQQVHWDTRIFTKAAVIKALGRNFFECLSILYGGDSQRERASGNSWIVNKLVGAAKLYSRCAFNEPKAYRLEGSNFFSCVCITPCVAQSHAVEVDSSDQRSEQVREAFRWAVYAGDLARFHAECCGVPGGVLNLGPATLIEFHSHFSFA